jgi:hypothetical protein
LLLIIILAPETIRSKKKVGFSFIPLFVYSRIRDEIFWDRDSESGIKT